MKKLLVEALTAGSEGEPLTSPVNPAQTVYPKFRWKIVESRWRRRLPDVRHHRIRYRWRRSDIVLLARTDDRDRPPGKQGRQRSRRFVLLRRVWILQRQKAVPGQERQEAGELESHGNAPISAKRKKEVFDDGSGKLARNPAASRPGSAL